MLDVARRGLRRADNGDCAKDRRVGKARYIWLFDTETVLHEHYRREVGLHETLEYLRVVAHVWECFGCHQDVVPFCVCAFRVQSGLVWTGECVSGFEGVFPILRRCYSKAIGFDRGIVGPAYY